jgi:hypothetical protein
LNNNIGYYFHRVPAHVHICTYLETTPFEVGFSRPDAFAKEASEAVAVYCACYPANCQHFRLTRHKNEVHYKQLGQNAAHRLFERTLGVCMNWMKKASGLAWINAVDFYFMLCPLQGCQIFLDTIYQNGGNYTKLPLNFQMAIKCTKWP